MRHEYHIRFGSPLRAVHVGDPDAARQRQQAAQAESESRAMAEIAATREMELQESRAVEEALAGLTEAAESLVQRQSQLLGEMQQVAIELATAIAMRVTYDKLQSDRFAIEELVATVVGRLGTTEAVSVRMHPEDMALLERRGKADVLQKIGDVRFIADDTLARGDCVADAGDVSLESCLEEELNGIRQHLLRNLSDAQIERRKTAAGDRELRRFPDRRQTA